MDSREGSEYNRHALNQEVKEKYTETALLAQDLPNDVPIHRKRQVKFERPLPDEVAAKKENLEQRARELERELSNRRQRVSELEDQVRGLQGHLNELLQGSDNYVKQCTSRLRKVTHDTLSACRMREKALDQRKWEYQQDLAKKELEISNLQKDLTLSQDRLSNLETGLHESTKLRQEYHLAVVENQRHQSNLYAREARRNKTKSDLTALRRKVSAHKILYGPLLGDSTSDGSAGMLPNYSNNSHFETELETEITNTAMLPTGVPHDHSSALQLAPPLGHGIGVSSGGPVRPSESSNVIFNLSGINHTDHDTYSQLLSNEFFPGYSDTSVYSNVGLNQTVPGHTNPTTYPNVRPEQSALGYIYPNTYPNVGPDQFALGYTNLNAISNDDSGHEDFEGSNGELKGFPGMWIQGIHGFDRVQGAQGT